MSDRLEILIRNKRKEFDQFEPPANLWEKIETELERGDKKTAAKQRILRFRSILQIAAVLAVVASAGLLLLKYRYAGSTDISAISPELAQQQVHYASMIEERRTELNQVKTMDPALYREFSSELKKLDENYEKLKNGLATSPNQEETLKAMVRNLQAHAEILNQQLQIIQQIKQFKKQENETKSI